MKAKESTFTSDKTLLRELLGAIDLGVLQLPDFQRGWVWDDEHIKDLIESISLSYPIGTVMLLETGGDGVRFKPRPIDGAPEPQEALEHLILDGQQRLTSMYQALWSQGVVATKDARKKPITRWYYIKMDEALRPNADRNDAIISIAEDRLVKNFRGEVQQDYSSSEGEYAALLFPLNQIFDSAEWRRGFNEYWNHDPVKAKLFDDFEKDIIDRFKSYQVPIIEVKKQTPKEAVCQVFEKVNTGGVSLTVFELLTASFAADDYNLRDDWDARIKSLKQLRVLSSTQSTDFLQAIALLVTYKNRLDAIASEKPEAEIPGVGCKRKDILRLTVEDYTKWADSVEAGFAQVARFLRRQRIFDARDLPYRTQLVPLAAVFAWLGRNGESDGVQNQLAQWYWCGVLGELYGSAVESRFARDMPEIIQWVKEKEYPPKTVTDANFTPNRLRTLRTRNSAAYKGIHALMMRGGCQDFLTGRGIEEQLYFEDQVDIHHIFPVDWCDDNGVDDGLRDCIINKTPLSARTNRMIGGNAPSVYLSRIQREGDIDDSRMNVILETHSINPVSLRSNDFNNFFEARQENLLWLIEQAMGKQIARETANLETQDDEDYEGAEVIEVQL